MDGKTFALIVSSAFGSRSLPRPVKKRGDASPFPKNAGHTPVAGKNVPTAPQWRMRGHFSKASDVVVRLTGMTAVSGLEGQPSPRRLGKGPAIPFAAQRGFAAKGCVAEELHLAFAQIFSGGIQFKEVFFFLAEHGRRFLGHHALFQRRNRSGSHDRDHLGICLSRDRLAGL